LGETNFTGVEFDRVKAGQLKLHGAIAGKEFMALLAPPPVAKAG
jgi:hypothetical protein